MKSTGTAARLGMAAAIVVGSQALALTALAQDKKPEPEFTFAGNAGLFSDYRFRGFSQTGFSPAFQGGFDFSTKSGFYLGNWNSNVEQALYNGASLEMDLYGGYKGTVGDIGYDIGYLYYHYPNSGALNSTKIKHSELYVGASYGAYAAKWFYATGHFFSIGKPPSYVNAATEGSWYLDLSYTRDLGNGLGVNAHYGYQKIENGKAAGLIANSVADYKIGVTKDISGWILGAALIGTTEEKLFTTAESGFTKGAGKTSAVVSVSKTF